MKQNTGKKHGAKGSCPTQRFYILRLVSALFLWWGWNTSFVVQRLKKRTITCRNRSPTHPSSLYNIHKNLCIISVSAEESWLFLATSLQLKLWSKITPNSSDVVPWHLQLWSKEADKFTMRYTQTHNSWDQICLSPPRVLMTEQQGTSQLSKDFLASLKDERNFPLCQKVMLDWGVTKLNFNISLPVTLTK